MKSQHARLKRKNKQLPVEPGAETTEQFFFVKEEKKNRENTTRKFLKRKKNPKRNSEHFTLKEEKNREITPIPRSSQVFTKRNTTTKTLYPTIC